MGGTETKSGETTTTRRSPPATTSGFVNSKLPAHLHGFKQRAKA